MMHDIKPVRTDPAAFDAALARRGIASASSALLGADARLRAIQTELQAALARRNEASRDIGAAKAQRDHATADALMMVVAVLKERIPGLEAGERAAQATLADLAAVLPNMPAADVPDGQDETGNVVARTAPRPNSLSRRWSMMPSPRAWAMIPKPRRASPARASPSSRGRSRGCTAPSAST